MKKPLLTIAIPTYNRAKYIENCLLSFWNQIGQNKDKVEFIVSDNCSTDNTKEIVFGLINRGIPITYYCNDENKGADYNFVQCYILAKSQFVVAFGSDDMLENGVLNLILQAIETNSQAGIIHLSCTSNNLPQNAIKIFNNKQEFIDDIYIWSTLISANIINKKYILEDRLYKDLDTHLNGLHFVFDAVFLAPYNIIILGKTINGGSAPTWKYDFFEVFVKHLSNIIDEASKYHKNNIIKKSFFNKTIIYWFSEFIIFFKINTKTTFGQINKYINSFKYFKFYFIYWFYLLPIMILPLFFSRRYKKYCDKVLKKFI